MASFDLVDLFAGCGGMTRGFVETGQYNPISAVEIDPMAAKTYEANFGSHVFSGDIRDWLRGRLPEAADVVIGGPPCQGFSALGKQDPLDPRNVLWRDYVHALERIRPKAFIIENVPQFFASPQFADLRREIEIGGGLEDYAIEPFILNAADYGVPQARRRVIVIGRQRHLPPLGQPVPLVGPRRTVEDAFRGLVSTVRSVDLPEDRAGSRGPYRTDELHLTRRPTPTSMLRYRAIPPGGNRNDLPDELSTPGWRRHKSGSGDVMGRLWFDRPSVTIRTEFFKPEKGRYLHPIEHRPITHQEAARLQGFPDDFLWYGSKTEIAKQIGNAVPVGLARAIAEHILPWLETTAADRSASSFVA
ncbi:DNA cytosine methyltransferase [Curtobacterium poinsettiae]|uniref:DNA cytosine methyltransferase n=1 Tax=Curtobacterium poinsettiae TaxID=159612 RepID=UPI0021C58716|nr:DNA cytosine methyltransferase [Curtobacterium flaccumfaciens]MCU0114877.1 DNA cytosine methyltransferase [Curtobacterium flaccumfaciens]